MKPAQKKAAERAKLQEPGELVIRIQGTEEAISRITALLMFAEAPFVRQAIEAQGPLPWEEAPSFKPDLPLDIDYEVVRRGIVKRLATYLDKHGRDQAIEMLKAHGGDTLPQIPQNRLLELHAALA